MPSAAFEAHRAACSLCATWADDAARLHRLVRVRAVDVPDLSAAITADVVLPAGRVNRWRLTLRMGLVLAGLAQIVLGLLGSAGDSVGMAMSMHATHENAAFNLAIAAAFVAAAASPRRASGLVPLLATFMLVLIGLSIHDVADGEVTVSRLATHLGVLIGLVMLVVLDRLERALPPTWPGARTTAAVDHDDRPLRGVA
ncbi:MAG: zf-HC2 domain-containing protein [Jatrophihabitans sp.]